MFRVSQQGEGIDDADTIEGARDIVRGEQPGNDGSIRIPSAP
jgi:hypothetical protein